MRSGFIQSMLKSSQTFSPKLNWYRAANIYFLLSFSTTFFIVVYKRHRGWLMHVLWIFWLSVLSFPFSLLWGWFRCFCSLVSSFIGTACELTVWRILRQNLTNYLESRNAATRLRTTDRGLLNKNSEITEKTSTIWSCLLTGFLSVQSNWNEIQLCTATLWSESKLWRIFQE